MSRILINVYRKSDFGSSDRAIWVTGVWRTPELRLEPRYKNLFLPRNYIAVKGNELFIPQFMVDKFNDRNRLENPDFKYSFPYVVKNINANKDEWEEFRKIYKFPNDTPSYNSYKEY